MAYKIVVSKPTYNCLTETDPDNLIFTSDYNTLKYYSSGNVTVTVDYSNYNDTKTDELGTWYYHGAEESVGHGLAYQPFFLAYIEGIAGNGKYSLCPGTFADAGYYVYAQAWIRILDSKIYFNVDIKNQSNSGTVDFDFYYKIFKNSTGL